MGLASTTRKQLSDTDIDCTHVPDVIGQTLIERVRSTTELLELVAADRNLLDQLPLEDRERFHRAVADFYNPDPIARRRIVKAAERERTAARTQRVGAFLHETGIRTLRRKPLFTTPNFFPPSDFDP